jgi:hypothetical protein
MSAHNPTEQELICKHLWEHGKISQLQALREYGCMRLAAVVHRLRAKGEPIETQWREQKGKKYAVYYYKPTTRQTA